MTTEKELGAMLSRAGEMVGEGRIEQGWLNGHAVFVAAWQHARGIMRFDGQNWSLEPAAVKVAEGYVMPRGWESVTV